VHRRVVGSTSALRRHDARSELANDLFPHLNVVREVRDVCALEYQIA